MVSEAYIKSYDVECMPASIVIGRETETGVHELRFDAAGWLRRWPEMTVSILATAPQSDIVYPVRMHMDGTVAVWEITGSDTIMPGTGCVEVEGRCDGRRIVSASAAVIVMARMPGVSGDAPEPAQPWVDDVLDAAERAEKAADRAEAAGGGNGAVSQEDIAKAVEAYMAENPVAVEETDPTVPEWAKQPDKPSYTAQEVGAQPAGDYALVGQLPVVTDNTQTYHLLDASDIDATLAVEGKAADAKATGKAIAELTDEIEDIKNSIGGVDQEPGISKLSGPVVSVRDAVAKAPLALKIYGMTTQDGTPSVESPIIPTQCMPASGSLQFRVRGKNLVNQTETTFTVGVEKDLTISIGSSTGVYPGYTYTFSVKLIKANVQTGLVIVRAIDENNTMVKGAGQTIPGDGKLSLTFTAPDVGMKQIYIYMSAGTEGDTITLTDMQLELGDTATSYEAYIAHKTVTVTGMKNAFHGIPIETGGNYTDANGKQYVCDVMDFSRGIKETWCGYIESYAGESIPGEYMSSTGALTTGATVIYALEEAVETNIPSAAMNEYSAVVMNSPNTTINSMYGAIVSLEYERLTDAEEESDEVQKVFDPTHYGMTILWLYGDTTGMDKDNAVDLTYRYKNLEGTASVKWQGSSSLWFEKKNYTVKFDQEFEVVEGWGAQKKYCFKANFIDHSHARNVCCAKLWGQVVKSRATVPSHFANLPNGGAVDGIPCAIMLNNKFHGLFTWNVPKDGWMMGMADGNREAILCAEGTTDAKGFATTITELDTEYSYEYSLDENDTGWIVDSLNTLITAVLNSDGSDLDTTIARYLDWDSAIDSYIFTTLISGHDNIFRNYILCTYDGVKWYFSQYDMDETFGQSGSGQNFATMYKRPTFASSAAEHKVYGLIKQYKMDAVKARYEELRSGVMSERNVCGVFANFIKNIPPHALMADLDLYPSIPSAAMSNYAQIAHEYSLRVKECDVEIEALSN